MLFNPENIDDMALKLHQILSDPELRKRLILKGIQISKKFSWEKTAKRYLDIIEGFPSAGISERSHKIAEAQDSKMKIAYFSPIHPQISGISQYSKELLLELRKYANVDLFLDKNIEPVEPEIIKKFRYFCYVDFEKMAKTENYDAILYHIGNNPLHEYIYWSSLRYPGITVLHDYVLHPFIKCITLDKGKIIHYFIEILYAYPNKIVNLIKKVIIEGPNSINVLEYPLNERILRTSKKVIVHSKYVKSLLKRYSNVCYIPHGRNPVEYSENDIVRNKISLSLNNEDLLISIFGFMNPNKRIDVVIRVFNRLQNEFSNIRLLLVGLIDSDIIEKIKDKSEKIDIIGYVPEDVYYRYLTISDIIINLRYPTMGETSGTLLDAMAFGKPVIVSNVGSYKETPDNCCWKVDLDENEEELLYQFLRELISNRELREIMGKNGKEFIKRNNNWEKIALQYIDIISLNRIVR